MEVSSWTEGGNGSVEKINKKVKGHSRGRVTTSDGTILIPLSIRPFRVRLRQHRMLAANQC